MKRFALLLLLPVLLVSLHSQAQKSWFIGPGLTYSIPGKQVVKNYQGQGEVSAPDTVINFRPQAVGRIGLYVEVGREWIWDTDSRINGMDVGLHFKTLCSKELMEGTLLQYTDTGNVSMSYRDEKMYSALHPGFFLNFFNHYKVNNKIALRNNIGLNLDLGFAGGSSDVDPEFFTAQLHYRFGVVYKTKGRLRIMPSLETPIITAYPWQNGRSTYAFLDFRYRPLIFCIRFMLEDKPEDKMSKGCLVIPDKVESPQLWDEKMRRKKKG